MARIRIERLWKRFGNGEPVLRDCNLEIPDNEFLVLVGPSGSGKTTLLRIISGLETATEGDVYFDDTCVNDVDVGDRDIAMVFQNYGLYPHMNVFNNMAFGLRRRKVPTAEIETKVKQAAETLGIAHLLSRKPRELSGGQRQRVALGRAIVRDPAVFLLDEPLSNLDAHLRTQMRSEILKVHRAVNGTAVYVTHDQVEALTMGDRIAVMNDGIIQQCDTPDRLYDFPRNRFVAGFIGIPPMGFVTGGLHLDPQSAVASNPNMRVDIGHVVDRSRLNGGPDVTVGIRPEGLALASEAEVGDSGASWIRGTVDVVEPLGAETHVLFAADDANLIARLPRGQRVQRGEKVVFRVDPSSVHAFATDTGASLRRTESH